VLVDVFSEDWMIRVVEAALEHCDLLEHNAEDINEV